MRLILLTLFIGLPIVELAVLVTVGGRIGFWWTLFIILMTAVLGIAIIVNHGFSAAHRVQQAMQRGEPPLAPVVDGAMIVFAGVLLVTPGLIADVIGLVMLVPALRVLLARGLGATLFSRIDIRTATADRNRDFDSSEPPKRSSGAGTVIDGEFTRVDEPTSGSGPKPPDGTAKS